MSRGAMSKRILVIDDEEDIREVVCLALEEFGGWHTDGAGSGLEGIQKALAGSWDGILLDVSMPDMDGVAVYDQLQANPGTQAIPVILLTAKVLPAGHGMAKRGPAARLGHGSGSLEMAKGHGLGHPAPSPSPRRG